jgi:hypothetical protein
MARIIGGIETSHTPTIGYALDTGKQEDPAWAPIFAAYEPLRNWLDQKKPDVERGAMLFDLEKLAAVLGLPNAVVYAGMRGETLERFQASRNAPAALYSAGSSLKGDTGHK